MRIAKAVAGTIGSALVGLIITALAIPEWALDNLSQHAFQTVIGFLISAAFGGAVVFIIYATYMNWKLGSKPCKAFDNLRDIDELGECKSLADMVEPVRKLASKDVEIAELEKRPEQSAEEQKVKSILVSLDPDKLGLVGMVLARGSIDEHAEKGNRAFLVESGILARVEPSAIEALASYTLTSIASAVIAGDEALRESAMKQGQELAGRIEERSERAREELNAQRRLTETAARVPELERRAETAEAKLLERDAEASRLAQDDRILHMDYLTKGLLYAIATGDEFKTRDDDPSYLSRNAKNLEAFQNLFQMGLANYETCGMHELRWFGTELAAKLVEERSDLFGKAKEEVEEIRRKEGAA